MTEPDDAKAGGASRRSKVGRIIAAYGLDDLGAELESRWTGRGAARSSLRALADYTNQRVLRAAMEEAGMQPLDGEVENLHRLLTDDSVSRGMRTQAELTLEDEGIEVDQLEADFVSHQAVHTYLTEYRQVDYPSADADETVASRAETIHRLENRLVAVTDRILDNLASTDRITLGEFEVLVDVRVHCADCGRQLPVQTLLEERSCECGGPPLQS